MITPAILRTIFTPISPTVRLSRLTIPRPPPPHTFVSSMPFWRARASPIRAAGDSLKPVSNVPSSLWVEQRVLYLDDKEGPQVESDAARREMVRVPAALRGRHAVHGHCQGRGPPLPAAQ